MDITQSLKDTENSLRDFIASVLSELYGADWVDKCGVSPERLDIWRARKASEEKRQESGVVDERLIYYADFYDLKTILKKHWSGEFSKAFGEWKKFEVFLTELEKIRDPDAHRRELLPHQKHFAIGICGEIRSKIIRYRSKKERAEDFFPKIESARDSLGNIWIPDRDLIHVINTNLKLHPGDSIEFIVTASDPEDLTLEYGIGIEHGKIKWQSSNSFVVEITNKDIARLFSVRLYIRSTREYHANNNHDDDVSFYYQVLPSK